MSSAPRPFAPSAAAATEAPDSPRPYPSAPPAFLIRFGLWLRRSVLALAHAMAPPEIRVFELSIGHCMTELVGFVARHGIPDLLAGGPRSADELAAELGVDADRLHRVLRALTHVGLFSVDGDGRFANTRFGATLRSGQRGRMRHWAIYGASRSNVDAWQDIDETVRTGGNAFERVHGMSIWDWFDRHPDERENFAHAMMGFTVQEAPIIAKLYPWREVQRVCDVGGGRGTLLSELLVRHRHLRGVLCDAPGVLESARLLVGQRGVAERIELVPGNMFDEVPIGADAYVLKSVLHDWDDARSQKILGVVRKAMKPDARVVICEMLLERNDWKHFGTIADAQMMMVCGEGRERSAGEFARLLQASGFRLGRVFRSPIVGVVEGIAA